MKELYELEMDNKEYAFVYLGYAGVLLRTNKGVIALDPADFLSKVLSELKSLDLITYSHHHYDHYNLKDAQAIHEITSPTIISEFKMVEELRSKIPPEKILSGPEIFTGAREIGAFEVNGIKTKLFRGVHPCQILQFHVTVGRLRIFHAADSGYWAVGKPKVDVAFLPTGTPSPTCHPGVALAMAMDLKPTFAVAVHGDDEQRQKFKDLVARELPDTTVVIPQENELVILNKP